MSAYDEMLAETDRSDAERAKDGVYTPGSVSTGEDVATR